MFPFGTRARHMSRKLSALVNDEDEDDDDDVTRSTNGASTFPLALLFPWVTTVDRTTDFTTASSSRDNVLTERSLKGIA